MDSTASGLRGEHALPEGEHALPEPDEPRRRRLTNAVKSSLRDLRVQLAMLNLQIADQLGLKQIDLDCLDILGRLGEQSPSGLARLAGLHPATMTGILDRLERDGWITRERQAADRRGVVIRLRRERSGEIYRQYDGMNHLLDEVCAEYTEHELEILGGFLARAQDAGRAATDRLT
jgi:DNA-binding MarR family transcriptional regulator